jgi:hypothetical protein
MDFKKGSVAVFFLVFTVSGLAATTLSEWEVSSDFSDPIAVDYYDGKYYFGDDNKVEVLDPSGPSVSNTINIGTPANDLYVGADGVYVISTDLEKRDFNGDLQWSIPNIGGNLAYSDVSHIPSSNGNGPATFFPNGSLNKVDSNGNVVWSVSPSGQSLQTAQYLDSTGTVFTSDLEETLYEYDLSGNLLNTYSASAETTYSDAMNSQLYFGEYYKFGKVNPDGTRDFTNTEGYLSYAGDSHLFVSEVVNDDYVYRLSESGSQEISYQGDSTQVLATGDSNSLYIFDGGVYKSIVKTEKPVVENPSATSNPWWESQDVNISGDASDSDGTVEEVTLDLKLNGSTTLTKSKSFSSSSVSYTFSNIEINESGNYTAIVTATDDVGASSSSSIERYNYVGDGSDSNPYEVYTCNRLQHMNQNLTASYELVGDVDCSSTDNWNSGKGFHPIGDLGDKFYGKLYGNNHSITDVFINRTSTSGSPVGIFGLVSFESSDMDNFEVKRAEIRPGDLGNYSGILAGAVLNSEDFYDNVNVSGNVTGGHSFIGGLSGQFKIPIKNSYVDVNVTSNQEGENIGGFVGQTDSSEFDNLNVTGSVDAGKKTAVGGFAGKVQDATVKNIYSDVKVVGDERSGGIIGYSNTTDILNTTSVGSVTSNLTAGGSIGFFESGLINRSYSHGNVEAFNNKSGGLIAVSEDMVEDSFSTGEVLTSGSSEGGLIAEKNSGSVEDSYWDVNTSNLEKSDGGTALTTSEMQGDACSMEAFSTNVWNFFSSDYPDLKVFSSGGITRSCTAPSEPEFNSLENKTYYDNEVLLNTSAIDVDTWKYSFESDSSNTTFTPPVNLTGLEEGKRNLTVYAENAYGVNSSSVQFTIEIRPPNVSFNDGTLSDGEAVQRDWLLVNASVSSNVSYDATEDFNGSNSSFVSSSGDNYWTNHTSLQQGKYFIEVFANDSYDNVGTSGEIVNYLDTTPPSTSDDWPDNGSAEGEACVTLTAEEEYSKIDKIFYQWDNESYQNQSSSSVTTCESEVGQHNLTYYSIDIAGNNETETEINVTVEEESFAGGGGGGGGSSEEEETTYYELSFLNTVDEMQAGTTQEASYVIANNYTSSKEVEVVVSDTPGCQGVQVVRQKGEDLSYVDEYGVSGLYSVPSASNGTPGTLEVGYKVEVPDASEVNGDSFTCEIGVESSANHEDLVLTVEVQDTLVSSFSTFVGDTQESIGSFSLFQGSQNDEVSGDDSMGIGGWIAAGILFVVSALILLKGISLAFRFVGIKFPAPF